MCFIFSVSQTTCPLVNRKVQYIKNRLNEGFTLRYCDCKFVTPPFSNMATNLIFTTTILW